MPYCMHLEARSATANDGSDGRSSAQHLPLLPKPAPTRSQDKPINDCSVQPQLISGSHMAQRRWTRRIRHLHVSGKYLDETQSPKDIQGTYTAKAGEPLLEVQLLVSAV